MRWRSVVGSLAALALLGGCGLPDDQRPRVIAAEDAPLDLSEDPNAAAAQANDGDEEVTIYLVRETLLEPREVAAAGTDLEAAITALLAGPDERLSGDYTTAILGETQLNSAAVVDGGIAVLDLGCRDTPVEQCGILGTTGREQTLIFGQFTCTAMAVPGITGVRFLQDGGAQDAPTAEGVTVRSPEPVTCEDYRSLLAS